MELATQIRRHRIEHDLSQDELAAAIFVSRQTVSNWENDKTYPDVQSLVLLSQLFGISVDELIQGDVAVMRRAVEEDSIRMGHLSTAMTVLLVLSLTFFIALSASWRNPSPIGNLAKGELAGFAVFIPLFALSMVCAARVEAIKRRHDLVSYREIVAFANGEPLEVERIGHGFERRHPAASRAVKAIAGAAAGAVLGVLVYKLIG